MQVFTRGLIGVAGLGFLLAVTASIFTGSIMGIQPEAFSRASNNLALIAIALAVCLRKGSMGS